MSPSTAFAGGKRALRRGAFALAIAGLFAANGAQAADFTEQECKVISLVTRDVVSAVGVNSLSVDFRRSLANFMAPDGKRLTCAGAKNILTPTVKDVAAFGTIVGLLAVPPRPIDLQARGLRSVDPASLASLKLN